jgi:hypothetical protein
MNSKQSHNPIRSPSKTRTNHDPSNQLEAGIIIFSLLFPVAYFEKIPILSDSLKFSAHQSSSNPDRWKTQRRKESFVAQIERIRENNLKRREGLVST